MDRTNAERQRRYIARLKAQAAETGTINVADARAAIQELIKEKREAAESRRAAKGSVTNATGEISFPRARPSNSPSEPGTYPQSSRSGNDITAKAVGKWLEGELLADRISPSALDAIGHNALHLAQQYMSRTGGRLKKPRGTPNVRP